VQTVLLTVDAIDDDGAFGPYLGRVIGQAEEDASAALDAFSVVQPPSTDADGVRREVNELVGDVIDVLAEARIAMRRSDPATVAGLRPDLEDTLAALDDFAESQG
jgi:hypothetical protein